MAFPSSDYPGRYWTVGPWHSTWSTTKHSLYLPFFCQTNRLSWTYHSHRSKTTPTCDSDLVALADAVTARDGRRGPCGELMERLVVPHQIRCGHLHMPSVHLDSGMGWWRTDVCCRPQGVTWNANVLWGGCHNISFSLLPSRTSPPHLSVPFTYLSMFRNFSPCSRKSSHWALRWAGGWYPPAGGWPTVTWAWLCGKGWDAIWQEETMD